MKTPLHVSWLYLPSLLYFLSAFLFPFTLYCNVRQSTSVAYIILQSHKFKFSQRRIFTFNIRDDVWESMCAFAYLCTSECPVGKWTRFLKGEAFYQVIRSITSRFKIKFFDFYCKSSIQPSKRCEDGRIWGFSFIFSCNFLNCEVFIKFYFVCTAFSLPN